MYETTLVSHPPGQEVDAVHITLPSSRAHRTLTDRVSLRLGLWLLLSAARRAERREEGLDRDRVRVHARLRDQYDREAAHAQLLLATRSWR